MVTPRKKPKARKPKRQFIVDAEGRPTAVILPIEEYEDLYDLAAVKAVEDEPTIPWEEVKSRLQSDGLLRD